MGDVVKVDLRTMELHLPPRSSPFVWIRKVLKALNTARPAEGYPEITWCIEVELYPPDISGVRFASTWQQLFFKSCFDDKCFPWVVMRAEFFKYVSTTPQILRLFFEPKGPLEKLVYG